MKRYTKLVFFRVSEDEFQRLTSLCNVGHGTKTVSELARAAVERYLVEHESSEVMMMDKLTVLDRNVKEVQRSVEQLATLLGSAPIEGKYVKANGKLTEGQIGDSREND